MTEISTNTAQLEKVSAGHYILKGQLNFDSVPKLWNENRLVLFDDQSTVLAIDLSQLERSDSSGLAILVEWYREAKQRNKKISFLNLPVQMYDIARISGLSDILPLVQK